MRNTEDDNEGMSLFARTLRDAVVARGIGLERIRERLRERGTPVSLAMLSYWQSGRSQPSRAASIAAIAQLEDILRLPADTLLGPLGAAGLRERVARRSRKAEELWPAYRDADRELARLRIESPEQLTALMTADRLFVGADATEYVHRMHRVLRADTDGVDRTAYVRGAIDAADPPITPVVTALRGCAVGRTRANPDTGFFMAELLFGRALRRGETASIEYELTFDESCDPETVFARRISGQAHAVLIEIRFAPDARPATCERYTVLDGVEQRRELELDAEGGVHAFAADFGPGELGIRWSW